MTMTRVANCIGLTFSLLLFINGFVADGRTIDRAAAALDDEPVIMRLRGAGDECSASASPFAASSMQRGVRVFFSSQGLHFVRYALAAPGQSFTDAKLLPFKAEQALTVHRVDLRFVGAGRPDIEMLEAFAQRRWVYTPAGESVDGSTYGGVRYRNVYPGIDFECFLRDGGVKYQFVVHPGGDAGMIRLAMDGVEGISLRADGSLHYDCGEWSISDATPVAFTTGAGSRNIAARWKKTGGDLRFDVGTRRAGETLVIDPFLQWSSFFGGELSDYARDVAIDAEGSMLVCGYTASTNFPVSPGAMQSVLKGNFDFFVAKFSRERKRIWTTLYGGGGSEENPQIAISPKGDIVVAGSTSSGDLPLSDGAAQTRNGGRYDAFVLALDPSGERRWCSYLGGSYSDEIGGLAIDAAGRICIAGGTYSTNFPVTADAWQTSNAGDFDMFVARFTASGALDWASYLGGWSMDYATDIAVSGTGDMFLSGRTESTNLPAVAGGMQQQYGGGSFDGVLYRIDGRTRRIVWGSYFGGEAEDSAERLAVRTDGSIAIAGYTASKRFPVEGGSARTKLAGMIDAFVAVLDGNGTLRWSTLLGGGDVDKASGLDTDSYGNIFVCGITASKDLPLAGAPFQKEKGQGYDAFVSQFGGNGAYLWGSFFGAEGHDISHGLSADRKGNVTVVGGTESRGFHTTGNLLQGDLAGLTDAYVLRLIFNEPLASAGPDTTICAGSSVSLGGDIGGGQPPYLFSWSPTEGLNRAGEQRPLAAPARSTSYVMTVTDAEGAVSRDTVLVTVVPLPVADAGEHIALCPGSSAVLKGSAAKGTPPYSYRWSPADGLSNAAIPAPAAAPRRSTRYTLTVTDARGCSHSDSVLVTVHPGLSADAGEDRIACANSPVALRARISGGTAPFRYAWTPASAMLDPSAAEPSFIPRSSGAVTVTVTDANGCSASDTVRFTVHQPPVADAGDDISLCMGEKDVLRARVSGGKAPYTYRWSPLDGLSSASIPAPQITTTTTTRYTLTVTDANGCTAVDSVLVSVHPQPLLKIPGDVIACAGVPVRIGGDATAGTPPFRYSWNPAAGLDGPTAAMPEASPARNTTYTVTVTDANGCKASAMVRITVQPRPLVRVNNRVTVCRGAAAQLTAGVRGGTAPYSYLWSPAQGLSSPTVPNPTVTPSASTNYTVTVTDAAGCVVEEQVAVVVPDSPVADAGEDVSLCSGSEVSLNARISGGRAPYSYTWNPATGLSSTRSLNPKVSVGRTTVYTLTATDASGCISIDTVVVYATESPRVQAGADAAICTGASVQIGGPASGGTPPYNYRWSPSFGLSDAAAMAPTAAPTSSTQYTVTVTDARGCSATDQVIVTVHPAAAISLPREMTICRGQAKRIELTVSGGSRPYRYEWLPREGLSDGTASAPLANPIQTTTYTVTVIDARGCRTTAVVTVTVLPCNKADAGTDADLCQGERMRIGSDAPDASNDAVFSWTPAAGLDDASTPTPIASPAVTTKYVLQVRNSLGCIARDTVLMRVRGVPSVRVNDALTICSGGTARLAAQVKGGKPPYRYSWSPATGLTRSTTARPDARPLESTTYTVTVTDATGCSARDSVLVSVPQPLKIVMENDIAVCEGSSVVLGGSVTGGTPPFNFFWSPAEGLDDRSRANPTAAPRRSLRYFVTATDANGCQTADTVRITLKPAPAVALTPSGSTDICAGKSLTLNAAAGFVRYKWSDGSEGREIQVSEPGEYSVSAWNGEGCEGSSSVVVRVFPLPVPVITALGPLRFCEGDSVLLDAGAGYRSYRWSTGATTRRIGVRSAGEYHVAVRGLGDCEVESPVVIVTTVPAPVARIDRHGDTLTASDAASYQWLRDGKALRGETSRSLIVKRSGSYRVVLRNSEGCSATSEAYGLRSGALNNSGAHGKSRYFAASGQKAAFPEAAGDGENRTVPRIRSRNN